MNAQNVHLGTGPGNSYLNPFLLSRTLLNDLDKRSDHCPCQGYLRVKVHPTIFDDIGDLYVLLTQVSYQVHLPVKYISNQCLCLSWDIENDF